ncbi:hypothetical protein IN07_06800 [Modestobacter caceresii]|uniref:Uncharacterized protein n=1 Tax=Modestobacter caceresii TaxID=1522368 RepID=A0A098YB20_9ACTN|nr:hypothetical protein IN07_06800 [Modestobacter caceresii]
MELTVIIQDGVGAVHIIHEDLTHFSEGADRMTDTEMLAGEVVSHAENVGSLVPLGEGTVVLRHWK